MTVHKDPTNKGKELTSTGSNQKKLFSGAFGSPADTRKMLQDAALLLPCEKNYSERRLVIAKSQLSEGYLEDSIVTLKGIDYGTVKSNVNIFFADLLNECVQRNELALALAAIVALRPQAEDTTRILQEIQTSFSVSQGHFDKALVETIKKNDKTWNGSADYLLGKKSFESALELVLNSGDHNALQSLADRMIDADPEYAARIAENIKVGDKTFYKDYYEAVDGEGYNLIKFHFYNRLAENSLKNGNTATFVEYAEKANRWSPPVVGIQGVEGKTLYNLARCAQALMAEHPGEALELLLSKAGGSKGNTFIRGDWWTKTNENGYAVPDFSYCWNNGKKKGTSADMGRVRVPGSQYRELLEGICAAALKKDDINVAQKAVEALKVGGFGDYSQSSFPQYYSCGSPAYDHPHYYDAFTLAEMKLAIVDHLLRKEQPKEAIALYDSIDFSFDSGQGWFWKTSPSNIKKAVDTARSSVLMESYQVLSA